MPKKCSPSLFHDMRWRRESKSSEKFHWAIIWVFNYHEISSTVQPIIWFWIVWYYRDQNNRYIYGSYSRYGSRKNWKFWPKPRGVHKQMKVNLNHESTKSIITTYLWLFQPGFIISTPCQCRSYLPIFKGVNHLLSFSKYVNVDKVLKRWDVYYWQFIEMKSTNPFHCL